MQVLMKNTTCTLITKIGLGERVKREYSKTQKNPVEVTLSSNTIMIWHNHRLSRDCAGREVEVGSSGAMLRRTHRRRMGAKYLSHLIARIEATAMAKAVWRGLLTKSFTSMLRPSVTQGPRKGADISTT
jgi:hypothetical protein